MGVDLKYFSNYKYIQKQQTCAINIYRPRYEYFFHSNGRKISGFTELCTDYFFYYTATSMFKCIRISSSGIKIPLLFNINFKMNEVIEDLKADWSSMLDKLIGCELIKQTLINKMSL